MQTPFNMIILGMMGCGKTYYLLKMLEDSYRGHFDYIFLICPTFVYNMTYQEWKHKNDPDFLAMPCKQDDVDSYLQRVTWFAKGTNSLIIWTTVPDLSL